MKNIYTPTHRVAPSFLISQCNHIGRVCVFSPLWCSHKSFCLVIVPEYIFVIFILLFTPWCESWEEKRSTAYGLGVQLISIANRHKEIPLSIRPHSLHSSTLQLAQIKGSVVQPLGHSGHTHSYCREFFYGSCKMDSGLVYRARHISRVIEIHFLSRAVREYWVWFSKHS